MPIAESNLLNYLLYKFIFQRFFCDYKVKDRSPFWAHIETVHKGITYSCDTCEKTFSNKGAIRSHKLSKHDQIRYNITLLLSFFAVQNTFDNKISSSHQWNMFNCDQCDYEASYKDTVAHHLDITIYLWEESAMNVRNIFEWLYIWQHM